MLRNFIETIGSHHAQRSASSSPTGPGESRGLANMSPAFERWLQAYRRRLEQICEDANSRALSAAALNR
jgi:hypothetical protein